MISNSKSLLAPVGFYLKYFVIYFVLYPFKTYRTLHRSNVSEESFKYVIFKTLDFLGFLPIKAQV